MAKFTALLGGSKQESLELCVLRFGCEAQEDGLVGADARHHNCVRMLGGGFLPEVFGRPGPLAADTHQIRNLDPPVERSAVHVEQGDGDIAVDEVASLRVAHK